MSGNNFQTPEMFVWLRAQNVSVMIWWLKVTILKPELYSIAVLPTLSISKISAQAFIKLKGYLHGRKKLPYHGILPPILEGHKAFHRHPLLDHKLQTQRTICKKPIMTHHVLERENKLPQYLNTTRTLRWLIRNMPPKLARQLNKYAL